MSATAIKSVRRGKSIPERQSLWSFAGTASEIKNKRATRPLDNVLTGPIDKSQIKIFEKPLPGSGYIFKTLADGKTFDIPFDVEGPGSDFYKFGITPSPLYLISRCECPREDLDRTTVGVGELVNLFWCTNLAGLYNNSPANEPITWETTAGSLSSTNTWQTTFTAPSNETDTVTVTANVRDEKCKIEFSVIEPRGVDHADFVQYWTAYTSTTLAGGGMRVRPYIGPTNVSFYRVQILEVGQNASQRSGYFNIHTPPNHDYANGANHWIDLDCDNHWKDTGGLTYDWVKSSGWGSPWFGQDFSGGSYTWHIPFAWKVGSGPAHTNDTAGWNQVHTLLPNGTMTVTKFGKTVSRTIQNVYSGP